MSVCYCRQPIPGMYKLKIDTAGTCCIRFKATPFAMAWMTDIDIDFDIPSVENDMATVKALLNSMEAVPYRNRGDMEKHAKEANIFLERTRATLNEISSNLPTKDIASLFLMGRSHYPDLELVKKMMLVITPLYEEK